MLSKCIEHIYKDKSIELDSFLKLDDTKLWNEIQEKAVDFWAAKCLIDRTIFTRVYESDTFSTNEGLKLFKAAKENVKKQLKEDDYIIDETHKLPHSLPVITNYDDDNGYGIPILNKNNEPEHIAAVSGIIKNMDECISIKRIYVHKDHDKIIRELRQTYSL